MSAFNRVSFRSLCLCGVVACSSAPDPDYPGTSEPAPNELAPREPLEPEQVLFSLRGKQSAALSCFEDGDAKGVVHLQWVANPDGSVRGASIRESTVDQREVALCLTRFVGDLRFQRREQPASASWTFVRGVADRTELERAAQERQDAPKWQRKREAEKRNRGVVVDKESRGRLPIATIEEVAEHGFPLYAACMREGLFRDNALQGRVLLHFTIDENGRVQELRDAGSDLPDPQVIDCVAEAFYALQFPEPEGGEVRVTYPILLNERDD